MSVLNLNKLLQPASVALIGASDNPASLGKVIMKNLLAGGFSGPVFPVNPKYKTVNGVFAYSTISDLPLIPDLAIICTQANKVPGIITELCEKGSRAAVVISDGFHPQGENRKLEVDMLNIARSYGFRILGPNCVGLLIPGIGLNASFTHTNSLPGNIALVSQSGAICAAILDWAKSREIGFSYFISLGNGADIDFGDLLDYLGSDRHTHSILLYIESIKDSRKFISAARATSRNKPVIVIKSGRMTEGARAATTHTGALAGNDDVFDAAIRRAGMLRVYTIQNLFDAVETLAHAHTIKGDRLLILTNGGGIGVLATDSLISEGGQLAELAPETISLLDQCLPKTWSRGNPVDISGDGTAERYVSTLRILVKDPNYDAILIMLIPTAMVDNTEVAMAITREIKEARKPVLTCWMGEDAVTKARNIFKQEGIPSYETPESAVRAFLQIIEYGRNQESLIEIPPSIPDIFEPDRAKVRTIFERVMAEGRFVLTEPEAKEVLAAYDIPVVDTLIAGNVDEVVQCAESIGFPVAIKILSTNITHKSDHGGVLLNIESTDILRAAAEGMLERIRKLQPDATIEGFTVQRMIHRPGSYELIIGVTTDAVFGPVILFGQGGTTVEVVKDKAVALPPLNMKLANDLMARTRIYKVLEGFRNVVPADLGSIQLTLVKISQLVIDHAELEELDINPLLSDRKGVLVLDARIRIKENRRDATERLAIRPYPRALEEYFTLETGQEVLIRPIKPEDEPAHQVFLHRTKPKDIYFRFLSAVSNLSHSQMARFTQIDYDREMAFIVSMKNEENEPETIGVIRAVSDADNNEAEFAIIVRSDMQKKGIGTKLMEKLIKYCNSRGIKRLIGQTLINNKAMQKLAVKYGFQTVYKPEDNVIYLSLDLPID